MRRRTFLRAAGAATLLAQRVPAAGKQYFAYWGTYTTSLPRFGNGGSKGIYVSRLDSGTGKLSTPELAAETRSPSYLAVHPSGRLVHCHSVNFTPDNPFLIATDTGLNKVFIHRIDPRKGTFTAHDPPFLGLKHQANPRQFRFHPNGKWAYIATESGPGCTMLRYDAERGTFEEGPTGRTVPESYRERMTCAEVEAHPSGAFVCLAGGLAGEFDFSAPAKGWCAPLILMPVKLDSFASHSFGQGL